MKTLWQSRPQADIAADKLRRFAQPQRLMILSLLLEGEKSVTEIDMATGIGQPALSQQLAELRGAHERRDADAAVEIDRRAFRLPEAGFRRARTWYERVPEGVRIVPLATTTTIMFLSPILVTVLSVPVLKERVGPRRWIGGCCSACWPSCRRGPPWTRPVPPVR